MPNNCLSVLYKHIIQVENKNMGLKVRGGGHKHIIASPPPPASYASAIPHLILVPIKTESKTETLLFLFKPKPKPKPKQNFITAHHYQGQYSECVVNVVEMLQDRGGIVIFNINAFVCVCVCVRDCHKWLYLLD